MRDENAGGHFDFHDFMLLVFQSSLATVCIDSLDDLNLKTGFVDILELGGITAYGKAVIPNEKSLPAAAVYPDLYATGNRAGAALQLEVLQAYVHPAAVGGALLP
jgi:hypothetical protein